MTNPWWGLLQRSSTQFLERWNEARVPILAASLAYYATFSLFPLLLLAVAGFGFALSQYPNLRDEVLVFMQGLIEQVFPSAADLLNSNLETFKTTALERLAQNAGISTIIALAGLFWSASGFFAVLQNGTDPCHSRHTQPHNLDAACCGVCLGVYLGTAHAFLDESGFTALESFQCRVLSPNPSLLEQLFSPAWRLFAL
jgi:uncharacterized BrkB/YihY/UPF0761 family membrane protein